MLKMSNEKTFFAILREYCIKQKVPPPTFEITKNKEDISYNCIIKANGSMVSANGRTKQNSKQMAAKAFLAKVKGLNRDSEITTVIPLVEPDVINNDMVSTLRDYCVQYDYPLPVFDLLQQCGRCNYPQYTIACSVASLKCVSISNNKKEARQNVSLMMLDVITESTYLQNESRESRLTLKRKDTEVVEQRYFKYKSYRELTESNTGYVPGVHLIDRHNFFTKFYDVLKKEAMRIINADSYESEKSRAMDVLQALKIEPIISTLKSTTLEPILFIDLNLQYEAVFAGDEATIYKDIVNYFRNMLY